MLLVFSPVVVGFPAKTKAFNRIEFSLFCKMAYSEEVKTLAETLKNSGLAASMSDALERAQAMIGVNEKVNDAPEVKEEPKVEPVDNAQTTLSDNEPEIKEGVQEVPEVNDTEEMKKEEVFTNKPAEEVKEEPNKPGQKKIDLTEIFDVNK